MPVVDDPWTYALDGSADTEPGVRTFRTPIRVRQQRKHPHGEEHLASSCCPIDCCRILGDAPVVGAVQSDLRDHLLNPYESVSVPGNS